MDTQKAIELLNQAQALMTEAIVLLKPSGCTGDCSNCAGKPIPLVEPTPQGTSVLYGKDGYTDEHDPRQLNARTHSTDAEGKPDAVWLSVLTQPTKRYQAVLVELLPDDWSCNIYVDIQDASGQWMTSIDRARMLTGWQESATSYDKLIAAQDSPMSFFMGSDAKFWPPNLGPLGLVIVNEKGEIDSDVVGSMGLPKGEHVSYRVVFRARW